MLEMIGTVLLLIVILAFVRAVGLVNIMIALGTIILAGLMVTLVVIHLG